MKKSVLIGLATISLVVPLTFTSCNKNVDQTCNIVKNHYREYFYYDTDISDYDIKPLNEIKKELIECPINGVMTYQLEGVNYTKDDKRADWPTRKHLSRALQIAIVAESRNSNELRDIADKLTLHWVYSNYHHINWWHNELGANDTLAKLGLFVFDRLGNKGQAAFNGKIRESSLKWRPSLTTSTGANLFDYADITIRNAAINNDKEELGIAFERMKQEITNDKREGFQKDGTFFQHGRQVQNVSYGKCAMRIAKTLYQLRSTEFKMPDEKMNILSSYVNNGLRASTFKGYTNYTTVGRAYDRVNFLDSQNTADSGLNDLSYYIGVDNYPGKNETFEFVDSLKKRKNAIKEDKIFYFPIGKMIVANIGHVGDKEGIYISYKGTDSNMTNSEIVNGENMLGLNLTYGSNTCVMDKGTEYFNISPVMNFNYMPGTTSVLYYDNPENPSSPTIEEQDIGIKKYVKEVYNDPLFTERLPEATATNGYIYNDGQDNGVTYMMTKTKHHKRASYCVTCFTTTDGMVLVGSDFEYNPIQGEDPEGLSTKMHTTLDQYVTSDGETKETGTQLRNHSDGHVKYSSLINGQTISKTVEERPYKKVNVEGEEYTWAWNRNHTTITDVKDSGTKNVATITLDGDNTTTYAYAIEPEYEDTNKPSKFKLAHNNDNNDGIHAIELPNGKIAAAFYNKNHLSFEYPEGKTHSITESEFKSGKGCFKIFE